jgi:ribonucleoside-diphosphate reductase alpha chain
MSPEAQFHAGVNGRDPDLDHPGRPGHPGLAATAAPPAADVAKAAASAVAFSTIQNQEDAPPCSTCGSIMIRSGACYKCMNCGTTSGCA